VLYLNFVRMSDTLSFSRTSRGKMLNGCLSILPPHPPLFKMGDFKLLKSGNLHFERNCKVKSRKQNKKLKF